MFFIFSFADIDNGKGLATINDIYMFVSVCEWRWCVSFVIVSFCFHFYCFTISLNKLTSYYSGCLLTEINKFWELQFHE